MKIVQALCNPHHDRQLVAPRAPFKRENGPPSTERDPRPNTRVPAEEEDPGAYARTTRFTFHGHITMTPRRTGRAPSHGKDRATAANANTTERSATLLETSFSMTPEASPVSLISTNS